MTLRAGSYNARKPDWRGVIRSGGFPLYTCYHRDHKSAEEARACAKAALAHIREHSQLPAWWVSWKTEQELHGNTGN